MELISAGAFLDWGKSRDIYLDPRCSEPRPLAFLPVRNLARFWSIPERAAELPFFLKSIIDGLDPWQAGYLWPRLGRFAELTDSIEPDAALMRVAFKAAGVPDGYAGAVRFAASAANELLAILFLQAAFVCNSFDDLYFVPEHGAQIVMLDHHEVIHVMFARAEMIEPFVQHMADAGYELPTEPPDETFIRPDWMG